MTLKSKDAIYKELVTIFNLVKIYIGQDLEYFRSEDIGKYHGLLPIF